MGVPMEYLCAICERRIVSWSSRHNKPNLQDFFCHRCFDQFRDDIRSGKEWTVYLRRLENNRRHRERRLEQLGVVTIYLDGKYDISDSGKLILATG